MKQIEKLKEELANYKWALNKTRKGFDVLYKELDAKKKLADNALIAEKKAEAKLKKYQNIFIIVMIF
jgi:soluble cytochrome b562